MDPATLSALDAIVVGDALSSRSLGVQALVLALTVGTALWTARRPGMLRALAFVACAAVWLRANHALEGAVLVTLTPEHGLTVADLVPPALLALILLRLREVRNVTAEARVPR